MSKKKKKVEKLRKIFPKKFRFRESFRVTEKGLVGLLYVFLLAISLTYAALIWGAGELAKNEKTADPIPQKDFSPREKKIKEAVKGFPIENMSSHISRQNPKTAAFLLGIAKKESNWGKFSPKKDGKECYNYWGYRGTYNQTRSGYSCFDSPKQAVRVVGGRVQELIDKNVDTPRELVVWKCGWDESCSNTPQAEKWIADVDYYYRKF